MITNFEVTPSTETVREFLHLVTKDTDGDYGPENIKDVTVVLMTNETGELVGFALLQIRRFPDKAYLHVAHIWIFPEFRGLGHHDNFIHRMREMSRELGCDGISAITLYKKKGFYNRLLGKFGFRPRSVEYIWEDK